MKKFFIIFIFVMGITTLSLAEDVPNTPVSTTLPSHSQLKAYTTPSGLKYADEKVGEGAPALSSQTVTVHYTGWLSNKGQKGTKFDSSRDRGTPFSFKLGERQVIAGWDEGVERMKVGGKRVLLIPSKLAYGERGAGAIIAPHADLIFEVELLGVQ